MHGGAVEVVNRNAKPLRGRLQLQALCNCPDRETDPQLRYFDCKQRYLPNLVLVETCGEKATAVVLCKNVS